MSTKIARRKIAHPRNFFKLRENSADRQLLPELGNFFPRNTIPVEWQRTLYAQWQANIPGVVCRRAALLPECRRTTANFVSRIKSGRRRPVDGHGNGGVLSWISDGAGWRATHDRRQCSRSKGQRVQVAASRNGEVDASGGCRGKPEAPDGEEEKTGRSTLSTVTVAFGVLNRNVCAASIAVSPHRPKTI
jgi:hypothetical protein